MSKNLSWKGSQWRQRKIEQIKAGIDEITLRIEGAAKGRLSPGRGKRTGTLQRDIQAVPARVEGHRVIGSVATGAASRKYARIVHVGRKAIVAKPGKLLVFQGKDGKPVRVRRVGAAKAIPFMTEGIDEVRPKALDILAKHMKD